MRGVREAATVPVKAEVINRGAQEAGLKRDIGGIVKNVAAYAGGIFAAQKVFDFGKEVVNEAAAVQKAEESIRSEYGKTAEEAIKFAHGQATSFGISAAASETASARIGALLQNMGFAPAKAQAMNLGLQKVVGAMSEMRNIDPATVLARLNTTLATGSTRGLRDLGVALDSASIKAEALKLHLPGITGPTLAVQAATLKADAAQKAYNDAVDKSGKHSLAARTAANQLAQAHAAVAAATTHVSGTLTVAEKDQAIYGLVTAHAGELQREAAKHSGDLAVQQKILSAEWANAKASLGEALLPVITTLFRDLVSGVRIIKEYRTEFVAAATVIATASIAWATYRLAVKAAQGATELYSIASKILTGNIVFSTGATEAQTAATEGATVAQEGLNTALELNPIGIVVGAVALLAGGMYELYQHSATARRIMNEAWADLKGIGGPALDLAKGGLHLLSEGFAHIGPLMHAVAGDARAVGGAIKTGIGDAVGIVTSGVHLLGRVWGAFWSGPFGDQVRFGMRIVGPMITDVVHIVRDMVSFVKDVFTGNWSGAWHDFTDIVANALDFALRGILGMPALFLHGAILLGKAIWSGIGSEVRRIPGQLWNLIRELPAAELRGLGIIGGAAGRLGGAILHGLINEAKRLPGQVWDLVRQLPGAELRGLGIIGGAALRLGTAILHGVISEARKLPGQVWGVIRGLPGDVVRGIKALGDAALSLGKRIVWGVIHGIGNLGSDLKNALEDKVKSALSDLNPFSPVEHGGDLYIAQPIMKGTTDGLNPFKGNLQQAIVPVLQMVMHTAQILGITQSRLLGLDISRNTIAGLAGLQSGLSHAITTAASAAITASKRALGISSPSSVFAREIGQPLAQGIIHGMGGLEKALADKVTKAAQSAMNAAGGFGSSTPQGSAATSANQRLGYQMMLAAGWPSSQWGALQALWTRESGWNANAVNPSSGAYGIPQSLGHGHPYNLGDARAQIAWGLEYIRGRYGSPGAAWAHEESVGWYHQGGVVPGSPTSNVPIMAQGGEFVLKPDQFRALAGRSISIGQVVIVEPHNGRDAGDELLNEIAKRIGTV